MAAPVGTVWRLIVNMSGGAARVTHGGLVQHVHGRHYTDRGTLKFQTPPPPWVGEGQFTDY